MLSLRGGIPGSVTPDVPLGFRQNVHGMRAALIVHRVDPDPEANLEAVRRGAAGAAAAGADLAVFSEAALTGLANRDDPAYDLPLGQRIPGPTTEALGRLAQHRGLWIAIGLLEREDRALYDSAILLGPDGTIALRYRRIHPGWHGPYADTDVYRPGTEVAAAPTPWGETALLLCGDLFDDGIVDRAAELRPGLLIVPFARSFDEGAVDDPRWQSREVPAYADRVARVGAPALLVNHLQEGGCFGGALAVSAGGEVIGSLPTGRTGMLPVDVRTGESDPS